MNSFVSTLLSMGLGGSLAAAALLLSRPALHRAPARWRRAGLLAATGLFLLPFPLLGGLLSADPAQSPAYTQVLQNGAATAPVFGAGQALSVAMAPAGGAAQAPALSPLAVVTALYLLGAAACLALTLARHLGFTRRLAARCTPAGGQLAATYAGLAAGLGLKHPPALYTSALIPGPLLVGLVRPRIVLPAQLSEQDQPYALRHELTHHKHGDLFFKSLLALARLVHWYNPLAWLLAAEAAEVCEQSCDEAVAATLSPEQRRAYAHALLNSAEAALPFLAAGFASPAKRLRRRIAGLLQPTRHRRGLQLVTLALALVALGAGALAGCSLAAGAQSVGDSSFAVASAPADTSATPESGLESSAPAAPRQESSLQPASLPSDGQAPAGLLFPVPAASYSSRGFSEGHKAQDINGTTGMEIVAAADGTVVTGDWHWSYGWHLVVDHGGGLQTLYANCDELYVQAGETVAAGQVIAALGSTGASTGPHCHFEVLEDGERVDPLLYISLPQ